MNLVKLAVQCPHMTLCINSKFSRKPVSCLPASNLPIPQFQVRLEIEQGSGSLISLTDEDYVPGTWVPIKLAREHFSSDLGGSEAFDEWVYKMITISRSEAYHTHASAKVWKKFEDIFSVVPGLVENEFVFQNYIRDILISLIADNTSYVEFRVNLGGKTMIAKDGKTRLDVPQIVKVFQAAVGETRQVLKTKGQETEFIGAQIVYLVDRCVPIEDMKMYLDECLLLKQQFPDIIAGFDMAGNEELEHPLLYYAEELQQFKRKQKETGIDVPFLFHAGETLGDGTLADDNLYDAILLGARRIGHGLSLVKHPHLMELCRKQNIALEVCPISNEILRLNCTMPMHPLATLLAHGVPVCLNNDDPLVFGNHGLSYDFYQVMISSQVTSLITLRIMARSSLEYSALDLERKDVALKAWDREWKKYVEEIADLDVFP